MKSILIFLPFIVVALSLAYYLGSKQPIKQEQKVLSEKIETPTNTPIPTPTNIPTIIPTKVPIPTPKTPSEKALKLAAVYITINEETKQKGVAKFSPNGSLDEAIRNFAIYLDENPEKKALAEAYLIQSASNSVAPPPPISVGSINCTSNRVGNYTYTNCY